MKSSYYSDPFAVFDTCETVLISVREEGGHATILLSLQFFDFQSRSKGSLSFSKVGAGDIAFSHLVTSAPLTCVAAREEQGQLWKTQAKSRVMSHYEGILAPSVEQWRQDNPAHWR